MVWRISAGVGPPVRPAAAGVEVRRRGGSARSWGARFACLTRRGRPLPPRSAPGEAGSGPAGSTGSGPVWPDSSHGGPGVLAVLGPATGIIGVVGGPAGPGPDGAGPGEPPAAVWLVQPGSGAGSSGNGTPPVPGNGAAPA